MDFLKDFGVNPLLLAAQVVNFLILLFILNKLLYKPILKVLNDRKKKIEDSLKNAEEIEKRLEDSNKKIDQMMTKAAEEIQEMMSEGQKMRDQILDEARQKALLAAETIFKREKEAIMVEKDRMMGEVRLEVADLVAAVFRRLTGKSLTKDDQRKLIEREVKNLS